MEGQSELRKFHSFTDPYMKAQIYFEKHQLLSVFQDLCAMVLYKKPLDPKEFMVGLLEDLLVEKGLEYNSVTESITTSEGTSVSQSTSASSLDEDFVVTSRITVESSPPDHPS
ncbi:unnamed protein product [Clavelina lepadiformis]|uniref:Uncharacterized protein n=1 Tax=Clavelina lepadiformis TaxID=159417 RepID=A0ABP0FXD3_CLALP